MKTTLTALHLQYTDWLRELDFYKEELNILTKRLGEVAAANTNHDVAKHIEHFQNRFIILGEQGDILRHDIRETQATVEHDVTARLEAVNLKIVDSDAQLLDRVQYFTKSFGETRLEFNSFVAKHL